MQGMHRCRHHLVPDLDNEILILKGKPNLIFHVAAPLASQVLNLHSRYVPSTPVRLHQFRKMFGMTPVLCVQEMRLDATVNKSAVD